VRSADAVGTTTGDLLAAVSSDLYFSINRH
jgi:hypothetical protein